MGPCNLSESTSQNILASSIDCDLKPALWSLSVTTKKTSWRIVVKKVWKKVLQVCWSVSAMLETSSKHMERPALSTSRLSCLLAHMHESMTNLNDRASSRSRAGKQRRLMVRRSLKNSTRCSGYSEKSLLIMSKVHSKTLSMMLMI